MANDKQLIHWIYPSRMAFFFILCVVEIVSAHAEEPALQGIFANAAQSEEPIKNGIEAGVKDLNFIIRPIARSRLKKTNSSLKQVEIARDGKLIKIVLGSEKPTITEPAHAAVKWTRDDGDVFDVSTEWQGTTLLQRFASADGQRENRFSLAADGATLTMQVVVTSPQLKAPVEYRLSFMRVAK